MKNTGYKKGQAVMEYLITYGLALFVILIVLGILALVVFPSLQAPETCQFTQPGFSCDSLKHVIVSGASDNKVNLIFQLDNDQGKAVRILGVLCSTAAPGNIRTSNIDSYGVEISETAGTLASGQSLSMGSDEAKIDEDITCVDEGGVAVVLPPGSSFQGTIAIKYEFTQEVPGAPDRIAYATVSGNTVASEE